jgi:hypothetical protein
VLWLVCADLMLHRVDIRALGSNAQTSRYNTCIISLKSNDHCDNWHALHVQWSWLFIQLQCENKRSPKCTNIRRIWGRSIYSNPIMLQSKKTID